ncbi:phage tail protein [Ewingella americana]|nr:phage tail protein [Ewingella americana]
MQQAALNNEPMRTIRLYGQLGSLFGREYKMAVKTPKEAIRALSVVVPGFEIFMNNSKRKGLTYAIFSGKKNISIDELEMDKGEEDIRIAPMIMGSKRAGVFQTILGAAIIAASAFYGYVTQDWSTAAYGIQAGAGIALGGVIQMLSPQTRGLANSQDADNKPSYAFGGPVNTNAQGNPVAWLYGRRRIGGAVISAGIFAEDQQ